MNMKFYSTKVKSIQRFRALSKKLTKMIEDGSFFQLGKVKQLELRNRLAKLSQEVRAVFSVRRIRKTLAASAILLGLAVSTHAQSFASPVQVTNGLVQEGTPIYHFADIDGDGDQDAFMSVYGDSTRVFRYQENTGTAEVAAFGDASEFPLSGGVNFKPTTIDFSDVDNDGDLDIFIGSYDFDGAATPIRGWENTGSATNPSFPIASASNPFNFQPSAEISEIAFADLDGDGDDDVLMNDYDETMDYEQFRYQENLGIQGTFPSYAAPVVNAFGLSNMNVETYVMSFDDLDEDGDQDLMISGNDNNYSSVFHYYENTGTPMAPAFAASVSNPFGLEVPDNSEVLVSDFVDLDGDGDSDIIATVYNTDMEESSVYFYENLGLTNTQDLSLVNQFSLYPTLADQTINWEIQMIETIRNSNLEIVDIP